MKNKILLISLAAIALAVIVLVTVLLLTPTILRRNLAGETAATGAESGMQSVKAFLEEKWPIYTLRSWDPETGSLALEYGWPFSYERLKRSGEVMEDAMAGQEDNLKALCLGMVSACGVAPKTVTVYGMSNDGREAYALDLSGLLRACWREENEKN